MTAPTTDLTFAAPPATASIPVPPPHVDIAADAEATTFAALGVPRSLAAVLADAGMTEAFPIQRATLPSTLEGRDVLGRGKTGSGKTLAFAIPMVARLTGHRARSGRPSGLILAPTRELATQIATAMAPLAAAAGLRVTTVYGGVSQKPQEAAFRAGVEIVVACPGRLDDLMKQGIVQLDAVEITVLDEADHMADLGFLPIVTRILNATPRGGQRLLFSATLDNGVDALVKKYLQSPVRHSVDDASSPVPAMTHHVFEVASPEEKTALVKALASGLGRRVLFMRTKHHAKKLAKQLTAAGIPSVDLHGNLSQNARDRNLADFSSGAVRVLVATDVAARGVHVDDVELVVHVDPPAEHKAYLHRSGRTARAGSEGDVATIMLPTQRKDTQALLRQARIQVTPQQVTATSPAVQALVGEVAEHVAPRAGAPGAGNAPLEQPRGTSQGANARRKRAARAGAGGGAGAAGSTGSGARGGGRGGRGGRSGADAGAHAGNVAHEGSTRGGRGAGGGRGGQAAGGASAGGRGRGGNAAGGGRGAGGGRAGQGAGGSTAGAGGRAGQQSGGGSGQRRSQQGGSASAAAAAGRSRRQPRRASWSTDGR